MSRGDVSSSSLSASAHDRLFSASRGGRSSPPREKRPYPIDSRCGYLQQNHVGSDKIAIAYEIFTQTGPGTHTPKLLTRHISTPSLGKRNNHVHEIIRTPLRNFFDFEQSSSPSAEERRNVPEKKEFATLFHDHHMRMAIDPRTRRTETPAAMLTHDFLLEQNNHDGKRLIKKIHFGRDDIPFGERNDYKKALPEYDPQYDSLVRSCVPRVKFGKMPKTTRFKHYDPVINPAPEEKLTTPFDEDPMFSPISSDKYGKNRNKDMSVYENENRSQVSAGDNNNINGDAGESMFEAYSTRSSQKKMKKKQNETIHFDDSCYTKLKHKVELTENNPKAINDAIKTNMFSNIYAISRPHYTKKIDTQIIDRLKKYV